MDASKRLTAASALIANTYHLPASMGDVAGCHDQPPAEWYQRPGLATSTTHIARTRPANFPGITNVGLTARRKSGAILGTYRGPSGVGLAWEGGIDQIGSESRPARMRSMRGVQIAWIARHAARISSGLGSGFAEP